MMNENRIKRIAQKAKEEVAYFYPFIACNVGGLFFTMSIKETSLFMNLFFWFLASISWIYALNTATERKASQVKMEVATELINEIKRID